MGSGIFIGISSMAMLDYIKYEVKKNKRIGLGHPKFEAERIQHSGKHFEKICNLAKNNPHDILLNETDISDTEDAEYRNTQSEQYTKEIVEGLIKTTEIMDKKSPKTIGSVIKQKFKNFLKK
jgi:hypothetical protein